MAAMMGSYVVVFFIVLLALAYWAGRWSVAGTQDVREVADPRAAQALAERDAFIEQLRELAWQHRDVSPELSTIVIDEIASHHRRLSGPND
jgi:hypothetical protein